MPPVAELLDCLAAEAVEIRHFIELLEAEAAALTERDSARDLMETTDAKQRSAQRLGELSARRAGLVAALGGTGSDYAAMQQVAERHTELGQAWQGLLDLADQARSLNQRNGALIEAHLQHTQMSLEFLRTAAGSAHVYDASGRTTQGMQGGKTIATG